MTINVLSLSSQPLRVCYEMVYIQSVHLVKFENVISRSGNFKPTSLHKSRA